MGVKAWLRCPLSFTRLLVPLSLLVHLTSKLSLHSVFSVQNSPLPLLPGVSKPYHLEYLEKSPSRSFWLSRTMFNRAEWQYSVCQQVSPLSTQCAQAVGGSQLGTGPAGDKAASSGQRLNTDFTACCQPVMDTARNGWKLVEGQGSLRQDGKARPWAWCVEMP